MRAKMDRAERAKQFMPFAALEGLEEHMLGENLPVYERVYLGEDAQQELDRRLRSLCPGREVLLTVYDGRSYRPLLGRVEKIDRLERKLLIGEHTVAMDDLLDIQLL